MMPLDLWYKNTIIYCVDIDTFLDSNGDGTGDFAGLTKRLDYLAGLGVTCLWLLPFYPSPNRDNGYDITDYYNVDEHLGNLGDFVEFSHQAQQHGMRVIIDLVINHTSDQHPWFQSARSDPDSPYRDYYVWSEEKPTDADQGVVFPGVQESTWTYDKKAKAYYFHRFYKHQPDLNMANPRVRAEVRKIMGFWLQLGIAGFRMDAAPFVIEMNGVNDKQEPEAFTYLKEFREFLSWRRADAILLAEANVPSKKITEYFGDGDKLHMLFNFIVNQQLFLALTEGRAAPLIGSMRKLPEIPSSGQWATFLRNHDEIDLGHLSDKDRQKVFAAMGPEPDMQIYDRGIRRRLAPMLQNDRRRIALAYSLLFSLPGTPVIWYGDEIGMGDNLALPERNSVRTPMQWSDQKNGGFSEAEEKDLIRPLVTDAEFGYQRINAAAQRRDPDALFGHIQRMIRTRKEYPELGWGTWQIIEADQPSIFALRTDWLGDTILTVANLAGQACTTTLSLSEEDAQMRCIDILSDRDYEPVAEGPSRLHVDGYGYRWLRLGDSPL